MAPQTETKTGTGFQAGVKDYRLTYYTPEYVVKDTDILAAFRVQPQPGVPAEEVAAATSEVAAKQDEPSTLTREDNMLLDSTAEAEAPPKCM